MMISASSASEVWDDRPRNIRAEVKSRSMYSLIALRRSISFTSCLLSNIVDDNTKSLDLFIVIFAKVQGSQAVQFPPKDHSSASWISIAAVPPVLFDSPVVCEQRVSMVVEGPFADNAVFAPGSMTCSRKLRISPVPFKSSDGNGLASSTFQWRVGVGLIGSLNVESRYV
ncbi:hypothetical protein KCU87_g339, partial [Aureobasidium melanogenum]